MPENNPLQPRPVGQALRLHLSARDADSLPEKMRQAYWWLSNNVLLGPHYDIEFGGQSKLTNRFGDELVLHESMSFSSFVLIPMLSVLCGHRALVVGGPGQGKGLLARSLALLFGPSSNSSHPSIPHCLIDNLDWQNAPSWLSQSLKVIDDYHLLSPQSQSTVKRLLQDDTLSPKESGWLITVSDNAYGSLGTPLREQTDVLVPTLPIQGSLASSLLCRIEANQSPLDQIPPDIVFSETQRDTLSTRIRQVPISSELVDRLGFFFDQLNFCRMASPLFDHKNKQTLRLSGTPLASVCNDTCPLDKKNSVCSQSESPVSTRAFQTCLHLAKALAYFRGNQEVCWEDLRQVSPWILQKDLSPKPNAEPSVLLRDRVAGIQAMLDASTMAFDRHQPLRTPILQAKQKLEQGLTSLDLQTVQARIGDITALMRNLMAHAELNAAVYQDLLLLKSLYSRYQNYARWLRLKGAC